MSTQSNKFYTIKEASQLSGLPSSTLRYYESIGIIQSVARDGSSGHRTYTTKRGAILQYPSINRRQHFRARQIMAIVFRKH